ncbi:hypothetical protein ILYODFUR_020626 [Ilyodon furcidens]|uniref:Uncharacterized protein n=1 Tax=Ilyodon furcidens TaxID=33524 RepID=A0ABV0UHT9_9TELE
MQEETDPKTSCWKFFLQQYFRYYSTFNSCSVSSHLRGLQPYSLMLNFHCVLSSFLSNSEWTVWLQTHRSGSYFLLLQDEEEENGLRQGSGANVTSDNMLGTKCRDGPEQA